MNSHRQTKQALLTSVMALVMCVVMLVGTTFAWFTDTATANVNTIKSGNLDVDMVDETGASLVGRTLSWQKAADGAGQEILWEPGATYNLDAFRIVNKGSLALKYEITVNGVKGSSKLLEAINFTAKINGREEALNNLTGVLLSKGATANDPAKEVVEQTDLITISGTMKTGAGNEYQGLTIDGVSITVVATQYTYEYDSKDNQYDVNAKAEINVNASNIQDYLDGKYGSIDGMTLVLAEGNYGRIEFGRATAYAGSNTKYYLSGTESDPDAIKQDIANHTHGGGAGTRVYVRSMSNVTLKAADGAAVTINGLVAFGGQVNSTKWYSRDFVADRVANDNNTSYYINQKWNNIIFERLTFTDAVNIDAFQSATVINGIKFDNCSFNVNDDAAQTRCLRLATGGDCKSTGLAVTNCKFNDGYEGVLTIATTDVTVSGCTFTGLSKNAIDLLVGTNGYGKVTVTNNTIRDMGNGDGVILRLGAVDAKAALTIKDNTASGTLNFKDDRAIKVDSLADGITYNISGNNWGSLTVSDSRLDG